MNGAHETLKKRGADVIDVYTVPGCYELPFACQRVIAMEKYDAVLAIGVLVKVCST